MLLIELDINGVIHRVSDEYIPLEHYWDAQVASMTSIKYSMKTIGGGYVKPSYGVIEFLPSLFKGETDYPVTCPIVVKHTSTNEADAVIIFEGTAHITEISRTTIKYSVFAKEYDTKVTDITYSGTLVEVFTAACTTLGLVLFDFDARNPSPAVSYKAAGEKVLVDNLSDMARFFSHLFYIEDGVLYLIDMLTETELIELTEFDITPSSYTYNNPISIFKTGSDTTEASVDGSYSYGKEDSISPQCHTTVSNSEIALTDRMTIIEQPQIRLVFPLDKVYKPGVKLALIDESMSITLNTEALVRSVTWDFDNYECVVEGDGVFL